MMHRYRLRIQSTKRAAHIANLAAITLLSGMAALLFYAISGVRA